jgi:peptidoglycan/LPS O-acetylase OafA/YrhL
MAARIESPDTEPTTLGVRERSAAAKWLKRMMPTSGATRDIAALDGLRALAILLVLWCHIVAHAEQYGAQMGYRTLAEIGLFGYSGVFLFFCLSGFLLFLPYARAILAGRKLPSTRKFYMRRALRILPLYFAAVIILTIIDWRTVFSGAQWHTLIYSAFLLHDMNFQAFLGFTPLAGVFWTLAIEWQFYLVLPFIALAIANVAGRPTGRAFLLRIAAMVGLLIFVGLGIRFGAAALYHFGGQSPILLPLPQRGVAALLYGTKGKYIEIFALGIGSSLLYVAGVERKGLSRHTQMWIGCIALAIFSIGLPLCFFWQLHDNRGFFWSTGLAWDVAGEWSLGIVFVALLIATLIGPELLSRVFALSPLRFIGHISYSMYVWHFAIITLAAPYVVRENQALGYPALALFSVMTVFAVSIVSYYLIERPFISYRRAAHSPADEALPAALAYIGRGKST